MKKIEKIQKELKVRFGLMTATAVMVFGLGACDPKVEDVQATNTPSTSTEQVVPSSEVIESSDVASTEVTPSSEVVDTTESTDVVEPTEEVKDVIDANAVISFIEDMSTKYTQIPKDELVAFTLSVNYDDLTAEDIDKVVNTYGYTYDELSQNFKKYCIHVGVVCDETYKIVSGSSAEVADADNYNFWPSHDKFILKEENKNFANAYENRIKKLANGQGRSNDCVKNYESFDGMNSTEISFALLDVSFIFGENMNFPTVFQQRNVSLNVK